MGEGERLHAQRRKRFWAILGGLAAFGFVAGLGMGFVAGLNDAGEGGIAAYAGVGAFGVIVLVLGGAIGSWLFFRNVDELEVADNLWGSLIGFYAYALLFPAWWALHLLEQVPEPDDWVIFAISMVTAVAVYLYRKIRYR